MSGYWLGDLEALEAITQDDAARRIFLRMSALSQTGRLPMFLAALACEHGLDDDTKGQLAEIARDEGFLLAVEEYLRRIQRVH